MLLLVTGGPGLLGLPLMLTDATSGNWDARKYGISMLARATGTTCDDSNVVQGLL